jgi:hypothetical protein
MFGHRSFLMLGGNSPADIKSLTEGGYEVLDCNFDFHQGIDRKGKATTRVYSGTIQVKLSQLPRNDMIEWALDSRKYTDGVIIMLEADNLPVEKFIFKNATCISFDIDYTLKGDSYTCTTLVIQSEKLVVGDGIEFENEWVYDK